MNFSRDLFLGLLRNGSNGAQILEILDLIASDVREQVCESLGIADCPENEAEITTAMVNL